MLARNPKSAPAKAADPAPAGIPGAPATTPPPRQLLDALPHPAAIWDAAGHWVAVNAAWRKVAVGAESDFDEAFEPRPLAEFRRRHAEDGQASATLPLRRGGAMSVQSRPLNYGGAAGARQWLLVALPAVAGDETDADRESPPLVAAAAALVDLLPMAAAVAEDARCNRVRVNAAMRGLFGLAEARPEPSVAPEVFAPLCRAAWGEPPAEGQEWLNVPPESKHPVRVRVWSLPLRDAAGTVRGAIAFYSDQAGDRDVAEQLDRSRDELRRALHEVRAASGTKDRFLAMISHELRTPLTPALVTLTDVIRELGGRAGGKGAANGVGGGEAAAASSGLRRDLETVRRGIELEARLIDDLLDLTRLARGRLKLSLRPLDFHAVVAETTDLARPEVEAAGLSLDVRLGAADARIVGDPDRLRQVVWNLLTNATKFNRRGGRIDVASSNPTPGTVRLDVVDTGIGIDPEEIPALFLAFEQMEHRGVNRFGGLGLALTISKGLLNLQGGRLFAESEGRGRGALFGIEFPLADPAPGAPPQGGEADAERPAEPPPLDILLVDDHAETLRAMRRLLQRLGHRVTPASGVAEARRVTRDRAAAGRPPFGLLVSDIGLPDGSGLEIPAMLRETWPSAGVPSIALSGFGMSRDLDASREAGFDVHLVKPVSLDQLQNMIARVVAEPAT